MIFVKFGVFCFMVSFVFQRRGVLIILMSLEVLFIITALVVVFYIGAVGDYGVLIIFLVVGVCEASLGLCLLILLSYNNGNDFVRGLDIVN